VILNEKLSLNKTSSGFASQAIIKLSKLGEVFTYSGVADEMQSHWQELCVCAKGIIF
jgi:hypothetical protein